MANYRKLCAAIFLVLCSGATAQERSYSLLEREIEYLMEIWPGDYDNREQLQFDFNVGKRLPEQGAHVRVHSQVSRVELPALGEYVLYVEDYRDNDPAAVFRQQLYVLSADEPEQAIRVQVFSFADPQRWRGAHDNPEIFASLTPAAVSQRAGCDLLLRRDVDAIAGGTQPGACAVGEGEGRGFQDYQLRLTESQLWFRQRTLAENSAAVVESMAGFSWHQLERARWFQCMIDFPREDGGQPVNTVEYLRTHDQGGAHTFTYRDGRRMLFTFRNNWSYGMQRETLVIAVQKDNEAGPTLVYAWAEPDSDRIGVNPGWIRLQCDLDTAKMRRFQRWLRPDS